MKGLESRSIAETRRTHGISPTVYYRWKDEMEKGALAAIGGRAEPRGPTKSRPSASSNWSVRSGTRNFRSRS